MAVRGKLPELVERAVLNVANGLAFGLEGRRTLLAVSVPELESVVLRT